MSTKTVQNDKKTKQLPENQSKKQSKNQSENSFNNDDVLKSILNTMQNPIRSQKSQKPKANIDSERDSIDKYSDSSDKYRRCPPRCPINAYFTSMHNEYILSNIFEFLPFRDLLNCKKTNITFRKIANRVIKKRVRRSLDAKKDFLLKYNNLILYSKYMNKECKNIDLVKDNINTNNFDLLLKNVVCDI